MPTGTPSTPATVLGQRLRDLRTRSRPGYPNGWTQEGLAEALGTRANRVSDWETGRHEPTLPLLKRIADVYGMTVSGILQGVM